MTPETKKAAAFRLVFYMIATGFILLVWQYQKHMMDGVAIAVDVTAQPLVDKQLDALLEMNRLITGLGTGLLGAIGFMLINVRKGKGGWLAMWAACASAVCVGLSLFFGYVVYLGVIEVLRYPPFEPDFSAIMWARQAHFYTFLMAVVLFADFAFNNLRGEVEHGK